MKIQGVIGRAMPEWKTVVGEEFAITARDRVASAETATFATSHRIPAILRPADRDEVQECVRIANRYGIALYPISSGKNWGYGSRVPPSDGCVLLDLGRLDRIVEFNEALAYVTVEPGVTQQQLHEFLRARGSGLWMDATGASPACSLIGNIAERGFGHTPYADHFNHVCGLEVILPTGELAQTGFLRYANSTAAAAYKWGAGPVLDGLFSQSNLGIVTRLTIWLMPAPEVFEAFFFQSRGDAAVGGIVDALRPLRLNGTLRSAVHIANDYKVLNGIQQYPWEETSTTPLSPALMETFRRRMQFGQWNGSGGLYGTKAQVAEARRLLRRALAGKVTRLKFLDNRKLTLASRFASLFRLGGWDLRRTIELVKPVFGLMQGIPTTKTLASAYWRKRTPPPAQPDPDLDGCGLLWCAPVAPADGSAVDQLTQLAIDHVLGCGFEPLISLTYITERAIACVIAITYDRDVSGEDERARDCYDGLLRELQQRGFYSYRLGIHGMAALPEEDGSAALLRTLKQALDPNGILAPGRYVPSAANQATQVEQ